MLRVFESGHAEEILIARVTRRGQRGLSFAEAVAETGWRKDEIEKLVTTAVGNKVFIKFQDRLFAISAFNSAHGSMQVAVSEFHKKDPLRPGMSKSELENEMALAFGIAPELFEAALSSLVQQKRIEIVGDLIRLPGRGAVMQDEEAESKKKIEQAFAGAGLKVPALAHVLSGLAIDKVRAQKIVTLLLREKVLVKISDDLVFHRTALDELRRLIAAQKAIAPKMDVAEFKDLIGVTRKYAIPLLEYLDRERVTRRVGDVREIL
jgi:selenocysteine-specific elongation factor